MDERCAISTGLGGRLYENAAVECPGLVSAPVESEALELEKLQAENPSDHGSPWQACDVGDGEEE